MPAVQWDVESCGGYGSEYRIRAGEGVTVMRVSLATLTPEENKAWDFAFAYYAETLDDDQAASMAWRDLQAEFPRLLKFDGCKP